MLRKKCEETGSDTQLTQLSADVGKKCYKKVEYFDDFILGGDFNNAKDFQFSDLRSNFEVEFKHKLYV